MFHFFRGNTSTPTGKSSGAPETSSGSTREEAESSSLYFSRFFPSPVFQNANSLCLRSSSTSLRKSVTKDRDPPLSLFNFRSPVRRQLPFSPQSAHLRPRNAVDFLNYSNSSMMERALRVLESKRIKRSNASLVEDESDGEVVSLKRYRINEENNSSPLLTRSVTMTSQEMEIIPRPKLKPITSTVRPSSSKLPYQVSRLSSATLEAIAFGSKRRRPEDLDVEKGEQTEISDFMHTRNNNLSILAEKLSPLSSPAAKRRATRDCETQTVFLADIAVGTEDPSSSPQQQRRQSASCIRSTSVSRFIAGLEARARANALSRRLTSSPAAVLTQDNSLETRHANIRRMFADLTQKICISLPETSHVATSANASSVSTVASSQSNLAFSPPSLSTVAAQTTSSVVLTTSSQSVAASLGFTYTATSEVNASVPTSTPTPPTWAFDLGKASTIRNTEATDVPRPTSATSMPNLPFVFGTKSVVSTETTTSASVSSTSTAPSFTTFMGLTSEKGLDKASTTIVNVTGSRPSVAASSALAEKSFAGVVFSSAPNSSGSDVKTAVTPIFSVPQPTFTAVSVSIASSVSSLKSSATSESAPLSSTINPFVSPNTASVGLSSFVFATEKNLSMSVPTFSFTASGAKTSVAPCINPIATTSEEASSVRACASGSTAAPASVVSSVRSSFNFKSAVTTAAVSTFGNNSIFNFSAKPSLLNTTSAPVSVPAPSPLVFNFSTKPDATKTTVFPAVSSVANSSTLMSTKSMPSFSFSATTTTAPVLFNFSKTLTTSAVVTGTPTMTTFNFKTVTTAATSTATTAINAPFAFPLTTLIPNGGTPTSTFSFSATQAAPAISTIPTTTTNVPLFTFSKTSTPVLTNGSNSGTLVHTATPFNFQNSSNTTTASTGTVGGFIFPISSSTVTSAPSTVAASFNFPSVINTTTPATVGSNLSGFKFSAATTIATCSSIPFAPTLGTGVFQFGAKPTVPSGITNPASSAFSLALPSPKSSPSIFSVGDHTKRIADSALTEGISSPKLQPPMFGVGVAENPSRFGAASGVTSTLPTAGGSTTGGGFNFSAAVATPLASFNFGQTPQSTPVFGQPGGASPNPFSAVTPTGSNFQRRRQTRLPRRR